MHRPQKTADLLVVSFLFALLIVAFLARSPYAVKVPLRDPGIFLHIGSDILHGKVLYLQTWDNKQPLLYVINAVGLWLGNKSVWGVWGLELALLMLVFFLSYRMIRSALSPLLSLTVIVIAFFAIFPFLGGNYSEEYSIVCQSSILSVLFGLYLPNRKRFSRPASSFAIGLLVGADFCIKQTYLDIPLTFLLFIIFLAWVDKDQGIIKNIALVGLGFFTVNFPVFLYFQVIGALRDYVTAAFLFNLYYSHLTLIEKFNAVLEKIKFITSHPLFFFAASVWLGSLIYWLVRTRPVPLRILRHRSAKRATLAAAAVCFVFFIVAQITGGDPQIGYLQGLVLAAGILLVSLSLYLYLHKPGLNQPAGLSLDSLREKCSRNDWRHPGAASLLFLGLIDFPIVIFTIALSGKPWTHYYLTLLPALILLLAGGLAYLYQHVESLIQQAALNSFLVAVMVTGSIPSMLQVVNSLSHPSGDDARSLTASYLKSVTEPEDTILVWGWESVIYFLAERESPTRFALPFAFYLDTPYKDEYAGILLKEVKARPPAYIADLMDPSMPFIGGRPEEKCVSGNRMENQRMVDFVAYICANYETDRDFGEINIYKLREDRE